MYETKETLLTVLENVSIQIIYTCYNNSYSLEFYLLDNGITLLTVKKAYFTIIYCIAYINYCLITTFSIVTVCTAMYFRVEDHSNTSLHYIQVNF